MARVKEDLSMEGIPYGAQVAMLGLSGTDPAIR